VGGFTCKAAANMELHPRSSNMFYTIWGGPLGLSPPPAAKAVPGHFAGSLSGAVRMFHSTRVWCWYCVTTLRCCRTAMRQQRLLMYRTLLVSSRVMPTRCCHAAHIQPSYVLSLDAPLQCACLQTDPLYAPTPTPSHPRMPQWPRLKSSGQLFKARRPS